MSARHTPGPWSLPHFARPDVNCECRFVLTDNIMGAIASVHCSGDGDDWKSHGDNPRFDEAVANAHLIAAAPDLLAALKRIDLVLSPMGVRGAAIDAIKAAIAKAEGRSND